MSALYRMAYGSHKQVEVNSGDRILIAASAIPGNEKSINNMVNELYKQGAEVIYDRSAAIHVSGHACQEDLKLMLGLCKPKYFIPVHGEYRMLVQHAGLAREMGVNPKNILVSEIGRPIEISENSARLGNSVPAGRLLVDGLGIGDVGTAVLRDRKHLSEDGLLVIVVTVDATTGVVIAGPDIVSRGFVYVKEAEALMEELRTISQMALDRCSVENLRDWNSLKSAIKGDVSDYLFKRPSAVDGSADHHGNLNVSQMKKTPRNQLSFSYKPVTFIHADLAQLFDHIRHGLTGDLGPLCGTGLFFRRTYHAVTDVSRLHAGFFQQGNRNALCGFTVNGQNHTSVQLLLGGQNRWRRCRRPNPDTAARRSRLKSWSAAFSSCRPDTDLIAFSASGWMAREQRLVQLGVEQMHKVAQLLRAEVCGDGVAVQLPYCSDSFSRTERSRLPAV